MYLPNHLKLTRWLGGFPLAIDPSNPREIDADAQLRLGRPAILLTLFLGLQVQSMLEFYRKFGSGLAGVKLVASAYGLSTLDVIILMALCSWACLCFLVGFATFVAKRRPICKLYKDISVCGIKTVRKETSLVTFIVGIETMMGIIGSCLFSASTFCAYQEIAGSGKLKLQDWVFIVSIGPANLLYITNPMFQGMVEVPWDTMLAMTEAFQKWTSALGSTCAKRKLVKEELAQHVSLGRRLCSLVQQTEDTLAPFFLFDYAYFLIAGVMYTFGGFDIIFHGSKASTPAFLLSAGLFLYASQCFFLLWTVSWKGSGLQRAKERAREALEDLYTETCHGLDERERLGMEVLLRRVDAAKISPHGFFEVSNSLLIGVTATVVTYIIVLLQFNA